MYQLRKCLCVLLLLLLLVSMLPQMTLISHAASFTVTTPSTSTSGSNTFTALPGVYEMGDGYAVIWATSFKGTGYIRYTYQGKQYTVYDQKNGIVRTGDTIHVVKVPHAHLLGNNYTVYSQVVTGHSNATTEYGATISAGPIKLRAYDGGTADFDALILTDVHGNLDWAKSVAKQFNQPDLIIFNGDTADCLTSKDDIVKMFNIMGTVSSGQYPIVYTRGNHEIRDKYATALLEYFPTETGEFYYDFTYGPLYSVVLDTGEDKKDSHEYYGCLANFTEYHQKQAAWLKSLRKDSSASFRLGIYHIPRIHALSSTNDCSFNLASSMNHLGMQFGIAGHTHTLGKYSDSANNSATLLKHTVFQCGGGGSSSAAAVMLTMNKHNQAAYVTAKYPNGTTDSTYNNYKFSFSTYVGSVPQNVEQPESGLLNHFNNSTSNSGVRLDTQPAVFETGGDWYNVVWKTTITNSSAKGATGYVEYTYNGKTYQVYDEVGGYRRTYDDYHTVRVPKEHLNNNTYKVGSFLMTYAYTSSGAKYYAPGGWVESSEYLFENRTGDTAVNLITCPDIQALSSDTSTITQAANAVAGLGTSPAYVILNGNAVGQTLNSGNDFTNLIRAAATVSGSIHPVILSRGFAECRGSIAPNLQKYLPTATGEFYYSVDLGDYTLVNLDTAEDEPDNKYGGRVFFDQMRQEQQSWLNSLPAGKLVVISSRPVADHDGTFGTKYSNTLVSKGAFLALAGHPDNSPAAEKIYTVLPDGAGSGVEVASVLFNEDYAYITECKYSSSGSTTYPTKKAIKLSSSTAVSYSAAAPSLSGNEYSITKPEHLVWLSNQCSSGNDFSGYTFRLLNDIDLQFVPFNPIGGNDSVSSDSNTSSKGFAGTFDGNGFTIRNLYITTTGNNAGLFGCIRGGTVKHLTLSEGMVDGGWYLGSLAGFATGATIEDCYSDLTVFSQSGSKIGGLIGFATGATTITRCANYGHVTASLSNASIGGILGQGAGSQTNYLTYSYNRGTVSAHGGSSIAGGLIGYIGNANYQISSCYNTGEVTGCGTTGAIIGNYSSSGKISFSSVYFAMTTMGASTGSGSSNSWRSASGSGTFTAYTAASMQSQSFADKLGNTVYTYFSWKNDGYPVHWYADHYGHTGHVYTPQVITPATCTQAGKQNCVCACGLSYTETVAAPGHNYQSSVTAPSCTQNGYTTYTCTACGHSYTGNQVAAVGHSYQTSVTSPSCTQGGTTTYTCSVCGDSYTEETAAAGHTYKYKVTKKPTTKATGVLTGTCSVCQETTTVTLPVITSGNYTNKVTKAATCTAKGTRKYTWKDKTYGTISFTVSISATGHSYESTVTDPTCTADGYTTYTCSACGDSYTDNQTTATGHSFKYKVTKSPTTKATGILTGTCSGCSETTTITLPVRNSTNYTSKVTKAATCTAKGTQKYTWKDKTYGTISFTVSISATGHSYSSTVTEPTCTADGYTTYSCSVCGDTYTGDAVSALGHSYNSTVTAPSCTADGYTTYTCSACGNSYKDDQVAATGHTYNYKVTKKPTTKATGVLTGTCSVCKATTTVTLPVITSSNYTNKVTKAATCTAKGTRKYTWKDKTYGTISFTANISATGHSYETTVTDPTCTVDGYTTYTCSSCGDSYTDNVVTALGHSYNSIVTAPTCTADGYTTYTCSACGNSYKDDQVAATGHTYKYKVTTKPTTKATGVLTGTCSVCKATTTVTLPVINSSNYTNKVTKAATCTAKGTRKYTWKDKTYGTITFTANISATGHSYETTVTDPTCTVDGYTTYTCSSCGDSYTEDQVAATGHTYKYKVTTKPTTKVTGVLTGTCSVCQETTTVTLPLRTSANYSSKVTKAATCTAKGTRKYTWKDKTYGTVSFTVSISMTAHSYTYQVTTVPTASKTGVLTGTCSVCSGTTTVSLPKLSSSNYTYTETKTTRTYTWNSDDYGVITFEVAI